MATPNPLYHEEDDGREIPFDIFRFWKALVIAAAISTVMWAALIFTAIWCWRHV